MGLQFTRRGRTIRASTLILVAILSAAARPARAADMYITNDHGGVLSRVNTETGAATDVGSTGTSDVYSAAFAPDGTLYGVNDYFGAERFGRFDLSTGAFTAIGEPFTGTNSILALEVASDGTVYASSREGSNTLWTIDPATGVNTLVGDMGIVPVGADDFAVISDFAFDSGGTLWGAVVNTRLGTSKLYTVNRTTGAGTLVSNISIVTENNQVIGTLSFDPTGDLFGTISAPLPGASTLYKINPTTGAATAVGSNSLLFYTGGGDIAVPEPAMASLLAVVAAAPLLRRGQRERAAP